MASFTLIVLYWVRSFNIALTISFLMVLPIIYMSTYNALTNMDSKLIEMAKVYNVPAIKKAFKIYLPLTAPYIFSACSVALGFAWKSGIAAEVIAPLAQSIGRELYFSNINLRTADMFAWTAVIVFISVIMDYGLKYIFKLASKRFSGGKSK